MKIGKCMLEPGGIVISDILSQLPRLFSKFLPFQVIRSWQKAMVSRSINWIDHKLYLRSDLAEALECLDNGGNEWLYTHSNTSDTNQVRQWLNTM